MAWKALTSGTPPLADNLRRLGRTSDAATRLRTAVTLAPTEYEERLLQARLRAVMSDPA